MKEKQNDYVKKKRKQYDDKMPKQKIKKMWLCI